MPSFLGGGSPRSNFARVVTALGIVVPVLGGRYVAQIETPIWLTFVVATIAFGTARFVELLLRDGVSGRRQRVGYGLMIVSSVVSCAYAVVGVAHLDERISWPKRAIPDAGPAPPRRHHEVAFDDRGMSISDHAACFVDATDSAAWCWGDAVSGAPSSPAPIPHLPAVRGVSVGTSVGCVIDYPRTLRCFRLRDAFADAGLPAAIVFEAPLEVAVGRARGCVVSALGGVGCFRLEGNLDVAPTVERIAGVDHARHVAVGREAACAVDDAGEISCWTAASSVAARVANVPPASNVAVSDDTICALTRDQNVYCWGHGIVDTDTPTRVEGFSGATALSVAPRHLCATIGSKQVRCKGKNDHGQLGLPSRNDLGFAVVRDLTDAPRVAAGEFATCAWQEGTPGELVCWGFGSER